MRAARREGIRAARVALPVVLRAVLAVVLAVVLAACAGPDQTGTVSQRVSSWVTSTGLVAEAAGLRADISRVGTVLERHDAGALHADCAVLSQDAEAAHQNLPAPDGELTNFLDKAYRQAFDAAGFCYGAARDSRLAAAFQRSARAAEAYLSRGLVRARALEGRP